MSSLQERLHRLRRVPVPEDGAAPMESLPPAPGDAIEAPPSPEGDGPAGSGLSRLERDLLGQVEDGLTLKQRLERLVAV
ncbi:MAG TPA: hypothetical protein VI589_01410, partial [Vicinamibacteria bacterium]